MDKELRPSRPQSTADFLSKYKVRVVVAALAVGYAAIAGPASYLQNSTLDGSILGRLGWAYLAPVWIGIGLLFARFVLRNSERIRREQGFLAYWVSAFGFWFYCASLFVMGDMVVTRVFANERFIEKGSILEIREVPTNRICRLYGGEIAVTTKRTKSRTLCIEPDEVNRIAIGSEVVVTWRKFHSMLILDSISRSDAD